MEQNPHFTQINTSTDPLADNSDKASRILYWPFTSIIRKAALLLMAVLMGYQTLHAQSLLPVGWTANPDLPDFFECGTESDTVAHGNYAIYCTLKMFSGFPTGMPFSVRSSRFPVDGGDSLHLSFYYNTSTYVEMAAYVYFDQGYVPSSGYLGSGQNDLDYKFHTHRILIPAEASEAWIEFIFMDETGFDMNIPETQYIDQVSVESPPGTPGTLVNGDFEYATTLSWDEERRIWHPSPSSGGDKFGTSLAISGSYYVAGAPQHQLDVDGLNPINGAGAAYVFLFNSPVKKLVPGTRCFQSYFGETLDIDGDFVIVGARKDDYDETGANQITDAGSAFLFNRNEGGSFNFGEVKKILPDNRMYGSYLAEFGADVAISGNTLAVQRGNGGDVYIFSRNSGGTDNWGQDTLINIDMSYPPYLAPYICALDMWGDYLAVGDPYYGRRYSGGRYVYSGRVLLYHKDKGGTGNWGLVTALPGYYGNKLTGTSVSMDGNYLVVNSGQIFHRNEGGTDNWGQVQKINVEAEQVAIKGDKLIFGDPLSSYNGGYGTSSNAGVAKVYTKNTATGVWELASIAASDDRSPGAKFGCSVAIGDDYIYVGAKDNENGKLSRFDEVEQASFIQFSNVGQTSFSASWVRGGEYKCFVFAKEEPFTNPDPFDMDYENGGVFAPDPVFGSNWDQETGWYCVYGGWGNNVTVTGLKPNTDYYVKVCEFDNVDERVFTAATQLNPNRVRTDMDHSTVMINIKKGYLYNTLTGQQYSFNSTDGMDGDWTYCGQDSTSVDFIPGEVWMRQGNKHENFYYLGSIPEPYPQPSFSVDFQNESSMETIPETIEYNTDNDFESSSSSGAGTTIGLTPGEDVYLRIMATDSTLPGLVQQLVVPARPTEPSFSIDFMSETTNEPADTMIEYSSNPGISPAMYGEDTVVSLVPGTDMYFRQRVTDTSFSGSIQHLVVPVRPEATQFSIDYAAETTNEIMSSTTEYSETADFLEGSGGPDTKLQLNPGTDMYIRLSSTIVAFSGEIQHLIIHPRPSVPTVSLSDKNSGEAIFRKSSDGTGSDVTIADSYEYSMDGGVNWLRITSLTRVNASGSKFIIVRKKAEFSSFASDPTLNLDYEKPIITVITNVACNGPLDYIICQHNLDNGLMYLIDSEVPQTGIVDLNAAVLQGKGTYSEVVALQSEFVIPTKNLPPGTYTAYSTNEWDSLSDPATIPVTIHGLPDPDLGPDIVKCQDTEVSLDAGSGFITYSWSYNNATSQVIKVTAEQEYSVTVTDENNCKNSDTIEVIFNLPYPDQEICIVTVDLSSGQNLIVWERTLDKGIRQYNIYREEELIGMVDFGDLSIFEDTLANPEIRPYLYYISVVDSCGNESEKSPYHKPLFLQFVSSEDGVNLRWSNYVIEGEELTFDNYSIYRGGDSVGLAPFAENVPTEVDVYTDLDPTALSRQYYYRVAGILSEPCLPSGDLKKGTGPYHHSLSNMDDNKIKEGGDTTGTFVYPLNSDELLIYPNPFTRSTTIAFPNNSQHPYKLVLTDISGKVYRIIEGITSREYVLYKGDLKEGIYFIELRGPVYYRGIVVIE